MRGCSERNPVSAILQRTGRRYDVGVKYGLLTAQFALGLDGVDRDQVLTNLLELLALRELGATSPRQDL
jgi:UTP--glucose-1-phosphate uridylyltransferase